MNVVAYKFPKRAVGYSKGMPKAHCAICEHFQPPNACEVVRGDIKPDMWCRKFKKK